MCFSTELIDGNGNFNTNGMAKFEKDVNLAERGLSYGIVSIIGPQSSGKSTLLNHLFGSDFKEMDAQSGRFQTTKGICLAQSPSTKTCILVLDTEGSDGAERRDNTRFARQTALFAIAISDIFMINMWHKDIGLVNAAGWPLMTVVFEVMLRVLTPRKVHLMFVLRDNDPKTPLKTSEMQLMKELEKTWNEISKPPGQLNTALRDRFKIEMVALASYRFQEKQFEEDVAGLKAWIISNSTSSEAWIPASNFGEYAKKIWDEIKDDKDLDLPSYRIMVAEVRCNRIVNEKYQSFCANGSWRQIENDVKSGAKVQGFGEKVSSLIDTFLFLYEKEALHLDETKRNQYKSILIESILMVVNPTYDSVMERMRHAILENFKKEALDELKRTGAFLGTNSDNFINQFRDGLTDVVIKQANLNRTTEQLSKLESEIAGYREWIRQANEILEKKKINIRYFWTKLAQLGLAWLNTASTVTSVIAALMS